MPNVAKVLKEEISRIGRKEAKSLTQPLQRRVVQLVRSAADTKRRLSLLESANKLLAARLAKLESSPAVAAPAEQAAERGWISGKGVKSLRKRLGLSRKEMGSLIDVSEQSIYNWESSARALKLRDASRKALFSMRGIGAREARRRLAELAPKAPAPKSGKSK